ncbi:hypothetical protein AR457_37120 [Streptomyces agglomeratus]|nr:hypothetical protein AR457_37120 [Streptomyces agglomeratus]
MRSLDRGGIRHAEVLQVTVAERSAWPVSRMVQARPGMRSVEDALGAVVTRSVRSLGLQWCRFTMNYPPPCGLQVWLQRVVCQEGAAVSRWAAVRFARPV